MYFIVLKCRYCTVCYLYYLSNTYKTPIRYFGLCFNRWGNSERLYDLPKVIQLVCGKAWLWIKVNLTSEAMFLTTTLWPQTFPKFCCSFNTDAHGVLLKVNIPVNYSIYSVSTWRPFGFCSSPRTETSKSSLSHSLIFLLSYPIPNSLKSR